MCVWYTVYVYSAVHLIQTPPRPTKFVLIMRCSNYESALNIKCKYNGLSRDHNHLSELTVREPELSGLHCIYKLTVWNVKVSITYIYSCQTDAVIDLSLVHLALHFIRTVTCLATLGPQMCILLYINVFFNQSWSSSAPGNQSQAHFFFASVLTWNNQKNNKKKIL